MIERKEVYSGASIKLIMHLAPVNLWTCSMAKSAFKDVCMRSLQCPPNSCTNGHSSESGGFQRNEVWQEGLLFSSFRCLIIPAEFGHSRIETGMFCGMCRNRMQQNPVVYLFIICLLIIHDMSHPSPLLPPPPPPLQHACQCQHPQQQQ